MRVVCNVSRLEPRVSSDFLFVVGGPRFYSGETFTLSAAVYMSINGDFVKTKVVFIF